MYVTIYYMIHNCLRMFIYPAKVAITLQIVSLFNMLVQVMSKGSIGEFLLYRLTSSGNIVN